MTKLSGKSLLLLELSILLAFFLFAAVTCTYMFVKAAGQAEDAEALNKAVVKTTSIAETLKATDGKLSKTGNLLGGKSTYETEDNQLTLYLDEAMAPSGKSGAAFTAKVEKTKNGLCNDYVILVRNTEDGEVVYRLEFSAIREGGASK
ncbi:MAG: hypothetical protein IJ070_03045 [Firmicutes bacterium]|nr:hypothetical protein [Bacillota bacterium]MBQ9707815.1 hypothetical protein [Bacillota bacterium]